jgi:hypothetical protein
LRARASAVASPPMPPPTTKTGSLISFALIDLYSSFRTSRGRHGITANDLERDDFSSNRHPALAFWRSMIFSENRYPLFRIML